MKTTIAILVAIMTLGTTAPTEVADVSGAVYSTTKEIEAVSTEHFYLDLVDTDGNAWRWCFDAKENMNKYHKGQLVSCLMDDMGTPEVEDDRFLMVTATEYMNERR